MIPLLFSCIERNHTAFFSSALSELKVTEEQVTLLPYNCERHGVSKVAFWVTRLLCLEGSVLFLILLDFWAQQHGSLYTVFQLMIAWLAGSWC